MPNQFNVKKIDVSRNECGQYNLSNFHLPASGKAEICDGDQKIAFIHTVDKKLMLFQGYTDAHLNLSFNVKPSRLILNALGTVSLNGNFDATSSILLKAKSLNIATPVSALRSLWCEAQDNVSFTGSLIAGSIHIIAERVIQQADISAQEFFLQAQSIWQIGGPHLAKISVNGSCGINVAKCHFLKGSNIFFKAADTKKSRFRVAGLLTIDEGVTIRCEKQLLDVKQLCAKGDLTLQESVLTAQSFDSSGSVSIHGAQLVVSSFTINAGIFKFIYSQTHCSSDFRLKPGAELTLLSAQLHASNVFVDGKINIIESPYADLSYVATGNSQDSIFAALALQLDQDAAQFRQQVLALLTPDINQPGPCVSDIIVTAEKLSGRTVVVISAQHEPILSGKKKLEEVHGEPIFIYHRDANHYDSFDFSRHYTSASVLKKIKVARKEKQPLILYPAFHMQTDTLIGSEQSFSASQISLIQGSKLRIESSGIDFQGRIELNTLTLKGDWFANTGRIRLRGDLKCGLDWYLSNTGLITCRNASIDSTTIFNWLGGQFHSLGHYNANTVIHLNILGLITASSTQLGGLVVVNAGVFLQTAFFDMKTIFNLSSLYGSIRVIATSLLPLQVISGLHLVTSLPGIVNIALILYTDIAKPTWVSNFGNKQQLSLLATKSKKKFHERLPLITQCVTAIKASYNAYDGATRLLKAGRPMWSSQASQQQANNNTSLWQQLHMPETVSYLKQLGYSVVTTLGGSYLENSIVSVNGFMGATTNAMRLTTLRLNLAFEANAFSAVTTAYCIQDRGWLFGYNNTINAYRILFAGYKRTYGFLNLSSRELKNIGDVYAKGSKIQLVNLEQHKIFILDSATIDCKRGNFFSSSITRLSSTHYKGDFILVDGQLSLKNVQLSVIGSATITHSGDVSLVSSFYSGNSIEVRGKFLTRQAHVELNAGFNLLPGSLYELVDSTVMADSVISKGEIIVSCDQNKLKASKSYFYDLTDIHDSGDSKYSCFAERDSSQGHLSVESESVENYGSIKLQQFHASGTQFYNQGLIVTQENLVLGFDYFVMNAGRIRSKNIVINAGAILNLGLYDDLLQLYQNSGNFLSSIVLPQYADRAKLYALLINPVSGSIHASNNLVVNSILYLNLGMISIGTGQINSLISFSGLTIQTPFFDPSSILSTQNLTTVLLGFLTLAAPLQLSIPLQFLSNAYSLYSQHELISELLKPIWLSYLGSTEQQAAYAKRPSKQFHEWLPVLTRVINLAKTSAHFYSSISSMASLEQTIIQFKAAHWKKIDYKELLWSSGLKVLGGTYVANSLISISYVTLSVNMLKSNLADINFGFQLSVSYSASSIYLYQSGQLIAREISLFASWIQNNSVIVSHGACLKIHADSLDNKGVIKGKNSNIQLKSLSQNDQLEIEGGQVKVDYLTTAINSKTNIGNALVQIETATQAGVMVCEQGTVEIDALTTQSGGQTQFEGVASTGNPVKINTLTTRSGGIVKSFAANIDAKEIRTESGAKEYLIATNINGDEYICDGLADHHGVVAKMSQRIQFGKDSEVITQNVRYEAPEFIDYSRLTHKESHQVKSQHYAHYGDVSFDKASEQQSMFIIDSCTAELHGAGQFDIASFQIGSWEQAPRFVAGQDEFDCYQFASKLYYDTNDKLNIRGQFSRDCATSISAASVDFNAELHGSGRLLSLISKIDEVRLSGQIERDGIYINSATDVFTSASLNSSNIDIQAKRALYNLGGHICARDTVIIRAGEIFNLKHGAAVAEQYQDLSKLTMGDSGIIEASFFLEIESTVGNVENHGGHLKAGVCTSIFAKESVRNIANQLFYQGKYDKRVKYLLGIIEGGAGDENNGHIGLSIYAEEKVEAIASDFLSVGEDQIFGRQGVDFKTLKNEFISDQWIKRTLFHSDEVRYARSTESRGCNIFSASGRNIIVSPEGSITARAANFKSLKAAELRARGLINLYSSRGKHQAYTEERKYFGLKKHSCLKDVEFSDSTVLVSSGNISIHSLDDSVYFTGASATAKTIAIKAGKDIIFSRDISNIHQLNKQTAPVFRSFGTEALRTMRQGGNFGDAICA